jgi:hypothetical protein
MGTERTLESEKAGARYVRVLTGAGGRRLFPKEMAPRDSRRGPSPRSRFYGSPRRADGEMPSGVGGPVRYARHVAGGQDC